MTTPLRYRLIRTPLERPTLWVRDQVGAIRRRRHPFAAMVHEEDKQIEAILDRVLTPTSNCLDIGAHYGSMLSAMLRRAPDGRHWAVEAIPAKVAFLREKFPEVDIHQHALGDSSGTVEFHVNDTQSGCSGLARHGADDDHFTRIQVELRTLDEMVADGPPFDLIKVDVEGAEELVFRGGSDTLRRLQPVVLFEASPAGLDAHQAHPSGIHDALTTAGLSVYNMRDWLDGGEPVDVDRFVDGLTYPFEAFNWVAAP